MLSTSYIFSHLTLTTFLDAAISQAEILIFFIKIIYLVVPDAGHSHGIYDLKTHAYLTLY